MITKTKGAVTYGVDAKIITIEVNIVQGTNLYVVGLPDNVIKESQHRIESVLKQIKCEMPRQRVIVNLAPADIKKEGALYDLPIALCILQSSFQRQLFNLDSYLILGELSLDGYLRPIRGVLAIALECKKEGIKTFILPKDNAQEAAIVDGIDVIPIEHINDAILFLSKKKTITPIKINVQNIIQHGIKQYDLDFSDVQGQENAKRALEIAAAGGHNLIMIGAPGAGKTMLAKRISTILPNMTLNESLETTKIYSVAGNGGINPQPGEISLAHNGVLFLDELPEFMRSVLEVMRQPLEERKITISRAKISVEFPANFMLLASMNPCPCGYYNHPSRACVCPNGAVQKYLNKISGPLLDRIDLHVEITPVSYDTLSAVKKSENSNIIQLKVIKAREKQLIRFKKYNNIYTNSMMNSNMTKEICLISHSGKQLIKNAMEKLGLSARAYTRILKVARTIADLDDNENITDLHISEAIHYRSLDRNNWVK